MELTDKYAEKLAGLLRDNKLVLFVGAGLSMQAQHKTTSSKRLPLWGKLADKVAKSHNTEVEAYRGKILDLFDGIVTDYSRTDLTHSVQQELLDNDYDLSAAHKLLANLPWKRVYTTNYDGLLKRALNEEFPIISENDFDRFTLSEEKQSKLIHLHGDLANMHTLTGEDYHNWPGNHPKATNQFTSDGTGNTILFVGYSNSDPHFEFNLLPLVRKLKGSNAQSNHSWMWMPTQEQINLYNRRDNIHIHPIENDKEWEKNFQKLIDAYNATNSSKQRELWHKERNKLSDIEPKNIIINGLKLFYHRKQKRLNRIELSRETKIPAWRIRYLEDIYSNNKLGPKLFKKCTQEELSALEKTLKPETSLEFGRSNDDQMSYLIEFHKNYWNTNNKRTLPRMRTLFDKPTKAVVFDFGGTLSKCDKKENTWERIWQQAGYDLNQANELHFKFTQGKITNEQWCQLTFEKLRDGGFSEQKLQNVINDICPVDGLFETFVELNRRNIQIHIVSGSLKEIIRQIIAEAGTYVASRACHDFTFDSDGILSGIIPHDYDFEGKARFIERVAREMNGHPREVLFVGNSLNDEHAYTSGAITLCVNPQHTNHHDLLKWNYCIPQMKNLQEILAFLNE